MLTVVLVSLSALSDLWYLQMVPIIGPIIMVFCLDPFVKTDTLDAFLETLRTKHAVDAAVKTMVGSGPARPLSRLQSGARR